jgi:hypothetical protein
VKRTGDDLPSFVFTENPFFKAQLPIIYSTIRRKVECKVFLLHAIEGYRGSKSIEPLILNLSNRWWLVVNFTTRLLCPWNKTPVPTE